MTETDRLAAEYALGLLEGEELLAARARLAREPDFADSVAFWETRLAPLADEIGGAQPSPQLWARIEAELDGASDSGEVIALRRKLRIWKWASAGTAVAAVAIISLVALQPLPNTNLPDPDASNVAAQAPMMASIPIADTPLRLGVTYLPDRGEMLVSASGLTADGVHDHELWLVPDEGELRSLGVVRPGEQVRMALDPEVASLIHDGSQMVLTREPLGGKPADADAGPVVAEGAFATI
ncbi:anti-sigma factor domain-containing protein [Erythrobacter sp. HKB08]|uniref:anti-sigma factor n=1 Tax=Erythrobacter sp. HKB08 TaxID=2502843 RepID=UPI0010088BA7|nr:anti-sigma factor [Erythrobacter sp. HKB08]